MNVQDMIMKKKELGYSNRQIAEKSGVPIGTVQKIFSGSTLTPRYHTLQALSRVFEKNEERYTYETAGEDRSMVREGTASYLAGGGFDGTGVRQLQEKTLEDYLALPEGTRIELIDGVFYDMAAATFIHQRIAAMIFYVFENFVNQNGGPCIPSIAQTDVQLDCDNRTMVQPDVLVVCDRKKIIKARVVGAPDLVVEVLSPSNWYMDMFLKLKKYKNAGVKEYWIVLPDQKNVMVYRFEDSMELQEYTFEDKVPVGIWQEKCEVDFKDIYSKISFLYD